MRLENWSVGSNASSYTAPELVSLRLHGNVYGHPRFDEGEEVTTSAIDKIDGDVVVTRSGSRYELGEVDPEYEKIYPDAKAKLLAN